MVNEIKFEKKKTMNKNRNTDLLGWLPCEYFVRPIYPFNSARRSKVIFQENIQFASNIEWLLQMKNESLMKMIKIKSV